MSKYMKLFIYASVSYLAAATIIGIINGTTGPTYLGQFAHTHFNLLGFMSMMVFGIGYFILPRFNGADLRFPKWVALHFWIGNASLIGMVLSRGLAVETGQTIYQQWFVISAGLQAMSIFMFVVNIWMSLSPAGLAQKQAAPASAARTVLPSATPSITPVVSVAIPKANKALVIVDVKSRVADLIDLLPDIKDVLVEAGLSSLALPGHIDWVRAMGVTLGMACRNHGLDLAGVLSDVRGKFRDAGFEIAQQNADKPSVTGTNLIGEVIRNYPKSRAVFQEHFGPGCFDCPGQAFESVEMACRMHGVEVDSFLESLNQVVVGVSDR